MQKTLERLEKYIIFLLVFIIPLAVTSFFPNAFLTIKLTILTFGVALVFLIRAVKLLLNNKFSTRPGYFDFGVIILIIAVTLSAILKSPSKVEAFFFPGRASFLIAGGLLYFLITQLSREDKKKINAILFSSGVAAALIILFSFARFFDQIPTLPEIFINPNFNTFSSNIHAVVFLLAVLPIGIGLMASAKDSVYKIFYLFTSVIIVFGASVTVFNSLPEKPLSPVLLDYQSSWNIAVDSLKESPFIGIGSGNYLTAFNRFRGLEFNQSPYWNLNFASARSFYLTILTENGLLGLLGISIVFFGFAKTVKEKDSQKNILLKAPLASIFILFLFVPASIATATAFFVLLGTSSHGKKNENSLGSSILPKVALALPIIAFSLAVFYFGIRALNAETKFSKAGKSLAENNAQVTYELIQRAIQINPYMDRYRASFSQINLGLANSIAETAVNQEVSDEDRSSIAQLIQQAISESKAAVSINNQRSENWELLAATYQSLVAFAEGANEFTIAAYNQAIALDPINPNLRIALGGVYYSLGDYDNAIKTFELATLAKPDFANAHYNLAIAMRDKGETQKAIEEMRIVLSLVDEGTSDYSLAETELSNLEQSIIEESIEPTESLSQPEIPEAIIDTPIEIPAELAP